MTDQLSVKELAKAYGYLLKGSCHCDGYETWNWKRDGYQLKWRKYRGHFLIMQGRTVIKNWTKVIELQETLKKIHPNVAIPE